MTNREQNLQGIKDHIGQQGTLVQEHHFEQVPVQHLNTPWEFKGVDMLYIGAEAIFSEGGFFKFSYTELSDKEISDIYKFLNCPHRGNEINQIEKLKEWIESNAEDLYDFDGSDVKAIRVDDLIDRINSLPSAPEDGVLKNFDSSNYESDISNTHVSSHFIVNTICNAIYDSGLVNDDGKRGLGTNRYIGWRQVNNAEMERYVEKMIRNVFSPPPTVPVGSTERDAPNLVWRYGASEWIAETPFGRFQINVYATGHFLSPNGKFIKCSKNIDQAKNQAQSHYNDLVKSIWKTN